MVLGVKNILVFNLTILNKWRWRILQGNDSLWYNVLKSWYDDLSFHMYNGGRGTKYSSFLSYWWRDIFKIGNCSFIDPIVTCNFVIHNGFNTLFWKEKWFEGIILKDAFPDLYKAYILKGVSVAAM